MSALRHAIADGSGQRDDDAGNKPRHHARQGAFHAGHHDHHAHRPQLLDALGTDEEGSGDVRAEQPFLRGDRVVVAAQVGNGDRHRAGRLGSVDEQGNSSSDEAFDRHHGAREPRHVRERDQLRPLRDRRIERSGYDVFSGRARVPRPRQALIAVRQWLWPS